MSIRGCCNSPPRDSLDTLKVYIVATITPLATLIFLSAALPALDMNTTLGARLLIVCPLGGIAIARITLRICKHKQYNLERRLARRYDIAYAIKLLSNEPLHNTKCYARYRPDTDIGTWFASITDTGDIIIHMQVGNRDIPRWQRFNITRGECPPFGLAPERRVTPPHPQRVGDVEVPSHLLSSQRLDTTEVSVNDIHTYATYLKKHEACIFHFYDLRQEEQYLPKAEQYQVIFYNTKAKKYDTSHLTSNNALEEFLANPNRYVVTYAQLSHRSQVEKGDLSAIMLHCEEGSQHTDIQKELKARCPSYPQDSGRIAFFAQYC